jgi:hypothetical protein
MCCPNQRWMELRDDVWLYLLCLPSWWDLVPEVVSHGAKEWCVVPFSVTKWLSVNK